MVEQNTDSAPTVGPDDTSLPARPEGVQLRARRSPRLIAIGVLCVCLGGLGAAYLYGTVTRSQQVVMVAQTVQRGEVIDRADLAIVTIGAAPGVRTVSANQLDDVVGKSALLDLAQGSLLVGEAVGSPLIVANTSQVGLKLPAGRIPTGLLPASSNIILVEIEADKTTPGRVFQGSLIAAPVSLGDGQTYVVDVRVASDIAPIVAVLAAQERIALIRQADR